MEIRELDRRPCVQQAAGRRRGAICHQLQDPLTPPPLLLLLLLGVSVHAGRHQGAQSCGSGGSGGGRQTPTGR